MSDDARLDSHETRISNLEAERGTEHRAVLELGQRVSGVESAVRTLTDGVARANDTANRALRGVDEMKEAHSVLERALMRAVDKAVSGTAEHLRKQDDVLAKQNEVLGQLSAGVSKLVAKADAEALIAANDKARGERIVWWAKAIAAVAAAGLIVIAALRFLFLKGQ